MKRMALSVAIVLALSMAICAFGLVRMNRILDDAHDRAILIRTALEHGDLTRVREGLTALANHWDESSALLELLCDHDDLHAVQERIIQTQLCFEYGDMEDFYGNIALLGENIEHIRDEEALRLSNFY